jgi:radical SAM superfamily enzyme YgiQ (UPF0313 family)
MKKNIVIFTPSKYEDELWLPALWCQAKTYYEKTGNKKHEWNWVPCYADACGRDIQKIQQVLKDSDPSIFGISLYAWNANLAFEVAKWVKQQWPHCLIISGGPHQDFKYNMEWFRQHPYLDASLPGDCYGELCFQQILDLYQNGMVDWSKINDIRYPVGKTRRVKSSNYSTTHRDKETFDYDWPSFTLQASHIQDLIDKNPNSKVLAILETTRGCPYGCTFCDWGGGTATSVIKKSMQSVEQDINFLSQLDLNFLFLADANFGIFQDRDIAITELLAKAKRKNNSNFSILYGGFAKTENRMWAIKRIFEIALENKLFYEGKLKLSLQSLDKEVLKAIDRKNIDLDIQLSAIRPLSQNYKFPIFVEMILGLPQTTLDKFYYELDVLDSYDLSVSWYEWQLLPETPAYSPDYMEKYKLRSVNKKNGWAWTEPDSDMHVVIESNTYSHNDYLQMLISVSAYHVLSHGGLFLHSINWIKKQKNIGLGQIIRLMYNDLLYKEEIYEQWQGIIADPEKKCVVEIQQNMIFVGQYFLGRLCYDNNFPQQLALWLQTRFDCPDSLIKLDLDEMITEWNYDDLHQAFCLYRSPKSLLRKPKKFWQRWLR